MTTQPKPKLTDAQRAQIEWRNFDKLDAILATRNTPDGRRYQRDAAVARGEMIEAKPGQTLLLSRGKAEIFDTGKVRLGDGFISAEFPPNER